MYTYIYKFICAYKLLYTHTRTGYIYMLCGAPVVWRSALQSITAQSTCEAEYVAANSAAREAEWCRMMYDDVLQGNYENGKPGANLKLPLLLMEDNQGCIALAKNFMVTARTKHFRLR